MKLDMLRCPSCGSMLRFVSCSEHKIKSPEPVITAVITRINYVCRRCEQHWEESKSETGRLIGIRPIKGPEPEASEHKQPLLPDTLTISQLDTLGYKYKITVFDLENAIHHLHDRVRRNGGIIYTQYDSEYDERIYCRGLRFTNRTGVYAIVEPK